jgi:dTDP-4-dehydrorhamnose reductase
MSGAKSVILLTGATGQVGGQLLNTLAGFGEIVAPTRAQMDLAQPESVRKWIRSVHPRWIVNPGAYTTVDKAEIEPEIAYAVNEKTVAVIGEEAKKIDATIIHFSTDYVFAGLGTEHYMETDEPEPVSVYGASKLAGERALVASGAAHIIFRTSWVYGFSGRNFLLTIRKLAYEREFIRVVADQYGAPTWSRDLAEMSTAVIAQCEDAATRRDQSLAEVVAEVSGIYHAAGTGETTWYGFASEIVQQMREKDPTARLATLEGIATAEYPTPAKRPANSRLDCSKLQRTFHWRMPEWRQSLRAVIAELPALPGD